VTTSKADRSKRARARHSDSSSSQSSTFAMESCLLNLWKTLLILREFS
jgi:hypothetical protein